MHTASALALGDDLIPDANMVFDRVAIIDASAGEVWPWLLQLGKRRAGWYLPHRLERLLPPRRRATRRVDPRWQALAVGDRIPDYGGRDEYLEVARIEPGRALVYRSERKGAPFTWALLLEPQGPGATALRLRFRGRLRSSGWRRRAIVATGDFFDWATGALMLAGLRERVAAYPRAN
ncbi:MAG TPA: hypothetical protein VIY10_12005 [Solirubrobacteraceae bacterium]|jgi:hypothetical protein